MKTDNMKQAHFFSAILFLAILVAGCGKEDYDLIPIGFAISFGDVYLGTTGTDNVQWENVGPAQVEMLGLFFGDHFGVFNFSAPRPFKSTRIPIAGMSPDVSLTFTPAAVKSYTSDVTPQLISPRTALNIRLYGDGKAQKATSNINIGGGDITQGQVLDFGDVQVGSNKTLTFDVINKANSPVSVKVTWLNGSQAFAVTNPGASPFVIQGANKTRVTVTFSPSAAGDFADAVIFTVRTTATTPLGSTHQEAGTSVKGRGISAETGTGGGGTEDGTSEEEGGSGD